MDKETWGPLTSPARKLISKTATAVVRPDGTGGELPDDRADLLALSRSLEVDPGVAYQPWPF